MRAAVSDIHPQRYALFLHDDHAGKNNPQSVAVLAIRNSLNLGGQGVELPTVFRIEPVAHVFSRLGVEA
jgi:hypothetical protein